ncbi:uncharacterized protein LOC135467219 [Liolophura sinensis]|uniref:uncharacterized protein LOC135467219 n=1 Tax=Liolophura sinensis TaxID=3198878 RepID=UPI003158E927
MELQTMVSPFLLFLSGILMCTLSLLLTSMTERLAWLFLFYCVIYGFGSSLVMNTPYSLIEEVFPITHKHHVTATSIMNVGAPLGMLLVNPLVAYLDNIEGHTWRDTIRIFSLVVLITGFVCSLPMTRRGLTIFGTSVNPKEGYEDLDKQCSDVTGEDQSDIQGDEKPKIRRKEPPARQNSLVLLFENQTAGILLGWTSGMFLLSVAIFIPKVHFIQYMHDLSIEPEVSCGLHVIRGSSGRQHLASSSPYSVTVLFNPSVHC